MGPVIRRRARHTGRATRTTSLATAFALGLSGLLAMPAGAKDTEPSDLVEACTDAPSAASNFNDYNSRTAREKQVIDCLNSGYRGNKSTTDFVLQGNGRVVNFDGTISRAQFAAILNRVADHIGITVHNPPSQATFADVTTSHFFFGEIEELVARGLTNGAGEDVNDVDNDGNTGELVYNPSGAVSYGQVLAFVHRLLTNADAANLTLASNRSKGQASNLDCGFFNAEKAKLDNAGFLLFANTPNDCRISSPRGLVFDLIAVSLDEAVQQDVVVNAHVVPAGSIALSLDRNSAFTNESVTATVKVLDHNGAAVSGQAVEIFAVSSSDAFDGNGNPKADASLSVSGTGRYGTGSTPAQIDANDPVTNGQGVATASIITSAPSGGTFDVYAFVGETSVVFKDVKDSADATGKQTVEFSGVPAGIVVTSTTSSTDTLQYGSGYTVTFQLVDEAGNPVKREGMRIDGFRRRVADCADPTKTTGACDSTPVNASAPGRTTDANGRASTPATGPADPDPTTNNSGDITTDTWSASLYDSAGNVVLTSTESYTMSFRDWIPGTVQLAKMELIGGNNPNKVDETGVRDTTPMTIRVRTTDFYGNVAGGVKVRFTHGFPVRVDEDVITEGNGIFDFVIPAPGAPETRNYTAVADPGGQNVTVGTPIANDTDLHIHWVNSPNANVPTTYSNQDIVGYSITGRFVDLVTGRVRAPFDSSDIYNVTGIENATMNDFITALQNDVGSNDRLTVRYVENGSSPVQEQSEWTLTVNAASGPVGAP